MKKIQKNGKPRIAIMAEVAKGTKEKEEKMRKIITILLVIALNVLCTISGFATEKGGLNLEGYEISPMFDSSEWYDQTTGKVAYPITTDCPEWKTFDTHNEMLEACTIPEDLLKKTFNKRTC